MNRFLISLISGLQIEYHISQPLTQGCVSQSEAEVQKHSK